MRTGFFYHEDFLKHETSPGHAESPDRLRAIVSHLRETKLGDQLRWVKPEVADWKQVFRVHPSSYIEELRQACAQASLFLDPDTPVSKDSLEVARLATSAVLQACDQVIRGELDDAFCAVRPPGHHAETARAMGFCLLNHVAVAARYLQKEHGVRRVLIVDWDVHHGNGTQEIFYKDPSVFYFSTHQFPFYPGTGAASERGQGQGLGTTLNVPMDEGSGDSEYVSVFEKVLVPAAETFRPEFVLISAGFDAHREDPLAGMKVTEEGFSQLTRIVKEIFGGRIVSVLEGGYHLSALPRSVAAHLEELLK